MNIDGRLVAATYARPCAVHVDPMEKKPLFHFFPGAPILSVGSAGCNLHCQNCQNADISQGNPEDITAYDLPPDQVPALAKKHGCRHVAYTYNEPLVNYEYTRDCCIAAHGAGLRNVLVTAGYANEKPLAALLPHVDAANVDIKGFSETFYREICDGALAPVLRSVLQMRDAGVHVEVTNLVIPALNDGDAMVDGLCAWLREQAGAEIPLHVSRFFPSFRMTHLPPTPVATLLRVRERAQRAGLKHVYVGNAEVQDGDDTFCAGCGGRLIARQRYVVTANRVTAGGACPDCGKDVYGVWA
jgi:pyruvate formate lyase activating enzyme